MKTTCRERAQGAAQSSLFWCRRLIVQRRHQRHSLPLPPAQLHTTTARGGKVVRVRAETKRSHEAIPQCVTHERKGGAHQGATCAQSGNGFGFCACARSRVHCVYRSCSASSSTITLYILHTKSCTDDHLTVEGGGGAQVPPPRGELVCLSRACVLMVAQIERFGCAHATLALSREHLRCNGPRVGPRAAVAAGPDDDVCSVWPFHASGAGCYSCIVRLFLT